MLVSPLRVFVLFNCNAFMVKEKLFQKKMLFDELKKQDKNFDDLKKNFFQNITQVMLLVLFQVIWEALILTLDGVGEWATTISIGKKNKINIIKELNFPHSLGLLYSAFTYYLGFKVNSGEYKVMGLAPYGKPIFKSLILDKIIDLKDDGSFKLNMKYFNYATGLTMTNRKFSKLFDLQKRNPNEKLSQVHMDLASSIQAVTELIVLKISRHISKIYKLKNLCLAGGVALNCVANGKILKENIFDNIWVQHFWRYGGSLALLKHFIFMNLIILEKLLIDTMKALI